MLRTRLAEHDPVADDREFASPRCAPCFAEVVPGLLYRGGQPDEAGWRYLRTRNVCTVLKLNFPDEFISHSHTDDAWAEQNLGMHVVRAPMPPADVGDIWGGRGPTDDQVMAAFAPLRDLMRGAPDDPHRCALYVHCTHGHDRTGLMVGLYRVVAQHLPRHRTWCEMLSHGYTRPADHGLTEFWMALDPPMIAELAGAATP